jgi:hypothetical protein
MGSEVEGPAVSSDYSNPENAVECACSSGWPSLSRSLRRLGLFSQSTAPQKNCHPDLSFSSRTGWEAQWRDLLFLSSHSNPENASERAAPQVAEPSTRARSAFAQSVFSSPHQRISGVARPAGKTEVSCPLPCATHNGYKSHHQGRYRFPHGARRGTA